MDNSVPPLNLSTTVKVEDQNGNAPDVDPLSFTVEAEVNQSVEYLSSEVPLTTNNVCDHIDISSEDIVNTKDSDLNEDIAYVQVKSESEYICSLCGLIFKRASQLRMHKKIHFNDDNALECNHCEDLFPDLQSLNKHKINNHTRLKIHACPECDSKFSHLSSLRLHVRGHKGEKPHKCNMCPQSFMQQSHLYIHMRVHTKERPFSCHECGQSFKQPSHLNTHIRTHTKEKPYVCQACNATFSQSSSLTRHIRSHTGEKPFGCSKCGATFVEKRNLVRHELMHYGIKPFECELCSARFTQRVDLRRHKLSHIGAKPFKCDECGASFSRKNNLKWHMYSHEGETPHVCDVCNAKFSHGRDLKNHKKVHAHPKAFKCDQCEHSFGQLNALKRHKLIHSGNRPFNCDRCAASFVDRNSLRRHMQRHDGIKSYHCEMCGMAFFEARNLKRHKVTIHGEDRYGEIEANDTITELKIVDAPDSTLKKKLGKQIEEMNDSLLSSEKSCEMNPDLHSAELHSDNPQEVANSLIISASLVDSEPLLNNDEQKISMSIDSNNALSSNIDYMPTLLLTQPGQPTKAARPANNCQNHNNHVLTYIEGSSQWQAWCFCEIPNIPQVLETTVSENNLDDSTSICTSSALCINSINKDHCVSSVSANDQIESISFSFQQVHNGKDLADSTEDIAQESFMSNKVTGKDFVSADPYPNTYSGSILEYAYQSAVISTVASNSNEAVPDNITSASETAKTSHDQNVYSVSVLPSLHAHGDSSVNVEDISSCCNQSEATGFTQTVNNPTAGEIQVKTFCKSELKSVAPEPPLKKRKYIKQDQDGEKSSGNEKNKDKFVYMCNCCSKTFSRINHLTIHKRVHSGERPYMCGVCKQQFAHANSLVIHMRCHTGEKPYSCTECNASFTQRSNLRVHMRLHTGERPFKCDICSDAFMQQSHLKAHRRRHSNERPYVCDECTMAFTQRSALNRHRAVHTGKRPHRCHFCGTRFIQKVDLTEHLELHSKLPVSIEYPYTCCGKVYSDEMQLSEHFKLHSNAKLSVAKKIKKECCIAVTDEKQSNSLSKTIVEKLCSALSNESDVSERLVKPKLKSFSKKETLPVRSSRRLKEAAEKQKNKNSEFIMGDFIELDDIEDAKEGMYFVNNSVKYSKLQKKGNISNVDLKDEVVQDWCFCEPHTSTESHISRSSQDSVQEQVTSKKMPAVSKEVVGIFSPGSLQIAVPDSDVVLNNSASMQAESAAISSSKEANYMTNTLQNNSNESVQFKGHINVNQNMLPVLTVAPTSQSTYSSQISSSTTYVSPEDLDVPDAHLMTTDGTIFVESGELVNQGAFVLNASQGPVLYYITNEGQVVNVPSNTTSDQVVFHSLENPSSDTTPSNESSDSFLRNESGTSLNAETQSGSFIVPETCSKPESELIIVQPRNCSVCPAQFAEIRTHRKHMSEHHHDYFVCSKCCKAFDKVESLQSHEDAHCADNDSNMSSDANSKRQLLQKPKVSDNSNSYKPHACSVCSAAFKSSADLQRHKLVHTGEKPVHCKLCNTVFTRISSLNKHMRLHIGIKSVKCTLCPKAFTYKYQLLKHQRSCHENVAIDQNDFASSISYSNSLEDSMGSKYNDSINQHNSLASGAVFDTNEPSSQEICKPGTSIASK